MDTMPIPSSTEDSTWACNEAHNMTTVSTCTKVKPDGQTTTDGAAHTHTSEQVNEDVEGAPLVFTWQTFQNQKSQAIISFLDNLSLVMSSLRATLYRYQNVIWFVLLWPCVAVLEGHCVHTCHFSHDHLLSLCVAILEGHCVHTYHFSHDAFVSTACPFPSSYISKMSSYFSYFRSYFLALFLAFHAMSVLVKKQ